jgi:hypothetical protein
MRWCGRSAKNGTEPFDKDRTPRARGHHDRRTLLRDRDEDRRHAHKLAETRSGWSFCGSQPGAMTELGATILCSNIAATGRTMGRTAPGRRSVNLASAGRADVPMFADEKFRTAAQATDAVFAQDGVRLEPAIVPDETTFVLPAPINPDDAASQRGMPSPPKEGNFHGGNESVKCST